MNYLMTILGQGWQGWQGCDCSVSLLRAGRTCSTGCTMLRATWAWPVSWSLSPPFYLLDQTCRQEHEHHESPLCTVQVSTSSQWSSSARSSWWTSFLVCSLESSQRSRVFISSFLSTIYLDKRQTCEVWKWLSLAYVYEILYNRE